LAIKIASFSAYLKQCTVCTDMQRLIDSTIKLTIFMIFYRLLGLLLS